MNSGIRCRFFPELLISRNAHLVTLKSNELQANPSIKQNVTFLVYRRSRSSCSSVFVFCSSHQMGDALGKSFPASVIGKLVRFEI